MSSMEMGRSEITPAQAAFEALKQRHEEARRTADETARRLGYELANDPNGDFRDTIETLRIEDAVAKAIVEDVRILGGFVSGLLTTPH